MNVDSFGVPDNFFGTHDEDFYGAIGRIAGLCALIENQTLVLFQTMMNLPQTTDTQLPASQLLDKAFKGLDSIDGDENKKILFQYFTDVKTTLRQRNDYIHNLWPKQPGDSLFGWRPNPDKETRAHQPHIVTQTNLGELKAFIVTLVEVVRCRDQVYGSACALQDVKLRDGALS